ncbi:MAG TPA: HD domain-containing protein [Microlunatus sp.]
MKDSAQLVQQSARLAATLLVPLPERWRHPSGVARRAAELAATVSPADRGVLIAAAWLHDIGYAPATRHTGFYPVDGGRYLLEHGWDHRIAALVAHHSGARFVADRAGLGPLLRPFDREDCPVSDALSYADQTVGPWGRTMTIHDRIADAITRHGPDSPIGRTRIDRVPYLPSVADRVEHRRSAGPSNEGAHDE